MPTSVFWKIHKGEGRAIFYRNRPTGGKQQYVEEIIKTSRELGCEVGHSQHQLIHFPSGNVVSIDAYCGYDRSYRIPRLAESMMGFQRQ